MQYWAVIDNERKGPMTFEELKEIGITPSTLVWKEGLENWVPCTFRPCTFRSGAGTGAGKRSGTRGYNFQ